MYRLEGELVQAPPLENQVAREEDLELDGDNEVGQDKARDDLVIGYKWVKRGSMCGRDPNYDRPQYPLDRGHYDTLPPGWKKYSILQ